MIVRELVIANKSGLHARPATAWVQTASRFKSSIRLKKGEREVDGKSLLGVLSLGLTAGSVIQLTIEGTDAEMASDELTKLLEDLAAKDA